MIRFALSEGWRNFRNISIIGLLTIGSMTLTLVLIGLTVHGYVIVESWRGGLQGRFEIEAFLLPGTDSTVARNLSDHILQMEHVSGVEFISQLDAANRFKEEFGEDILDLLGQNPLPMSLVISLTELADPAITWEKIALEISGFDSVDEVVYDGEILAKMDKFYQSAGLIVGSGVLGMLIISITFTIMTVMGSIRAKEKFIQIVSLSGGSRMMARGPFVALGGYYGLTAGLAATGIVYFVRWFLIVVWGEDVSGVTIWIPSLIALGVSIGIFVAGWTAGQRIKQI